MAKLPFIFPDTKDLSGKICLGEVGNKTCNFIARTSHEILYFYPDIKKQNSTQF
ncbi:MAG: hypothetical protein IPI59_11410 [Sphingobacteriales bacterium]|jgi:hypothetical protein|nr:hypothetical protein [Sphingobacteriales bacterium]MDA0198741.1 hypothetical protein [Bacteroidota bacterium]